MKAIVAVDENWGIGRKNELLVAIPADQKNFRNITTGNVVILGRKTMSGFPGGMPLKNRTNIVISKTVSEPKGDEIICHSIEETLEYVKRYNTDDVFVIGGESIYKQFLPYIDEAIVTMIDHAYEADAYFPNLDKDDEWEMTEESEEQTYFDITYTFRTYKRK